LSLAQHFFTFVSRRVCYCLINVMACLDGTGRTTMNLHLLTGLAVLLGVVGVAVSRDLLRMMTKAKPQPVRVRVAQAPRRR
jgi:hypothetical protein